MRTEEKPREEPGMAWLPALMHMAAALHRCTSSVRPPPEQRRRFYSQRSLLLLTTSLLFLVQTLHGQWSSVRQLTSGTTDDRNMTLVVSTLDFSDHPVDEWAAFSRGSGAGGRSICLIHTGLGALSWFDSVVVVSGDSTENDFPVLARGKHNGGFQLMLVWQERMSNGKSRLVYSLSPGDGNWSAPQIVLPDSSNDRLPALAVVDSTFGLAWVRSGNVVYSQFSDSIWSTPETVSAAGDSVGGIPQVKWYGGLETVVVVWEEPKPFEPGHALKYSVRSSSGWSTPDTIVWAGDNRNARMVKTDSWERPSILFESNSGTNWEIYYTQMDYPAGPWYKPWNRSGNSQTDDRQGSMTYHGCCVLCSCIEGWAWQATSGQGDSIWLRAMGLWVIYNPVYISAGVNVGDRNPVVSDGVYNPDRTMMLWCLWESDATGTWKIYGTQASIPVMGVDDGGALPSVPMLSQNYPNPFNPVTTIGYTVGGVGLQASGFRGVRLVVYDVLGREVAVLVNERKAPGSYSVEFDGTGLSSGIYMYRLSTGSFVQSRKMLLIK